MRAALTLAIALAALSAAPALAWEELPFRTIPAAGPATCVRATGADGGLTALGPSASRTTPIDLLAAGTGPPVVRARAQLGILVECPVLREQDGAAVAAGPDFRLSGSPAMRAAVRDAGGTFGSPVPLGRGPVTDLSAGAYDAAVSGTGHAVVAWVQSDARDRARVVAARRGPGGAFGPPTALTPWAHTQDASLAVVAGADGAGGATVAWTTPVAGRGDDVRVAVASAGPGAPFGAPQVLAPRADSLTHLSLAMAPDAGALLAHDGVTGEHLRLFERAAGAAAFGPGRDLAGAEPDESAPTSDAALALRDGGAAVVAWLDHGRDGAIRAMTRPAGGSFGPPRAVALDRVRRDVKLGDGLSFASKPDVGLNAALSGDGRAALAWGAQRRLPDTPLAPVAASGTLADGFGPAAVLGSPVRTIGGVRALVLAGGEPAVAWADNVTTAAGVGDGTLEISERDGRIHVARAGAPARPAAPPPAVRLAAPRVQRLFRDQGVRLRVRCAAACDVRAHLRSGSGLVNAQGASLPAAGVRDLLIAPGIGAFAPRRPRRVVVRVRVAAPGSSVTRTLRLPLRLVKRVPPPVPRILGARAVLRGGSIRVSWHTAFPARRVEFVVHPPQGRGDPDLGTETGLSGDGNTVFRATLRPERPNALRSVVIEASSSEGGHRRSVTVPVTR